MKICKTTAIYLYTQETTRNLSQAIKSFNIASFSSFYSSSFVVYIVLWHS